MTRTVVGVHEAKTHLSRLLENVAAGEEVEISRRGVIVARLVPSGASRPRRFGRDAGRIRIHEDFEAPLPTDLAEPFGA